MSGVSKKLFQLSILDAWKTRINVKGDGERLAKIHSYNEWEKSEAVRTGAKSRDELKEIWKKEKEKAEAV